MAENYFQYKTAIVREISSSLSAEALRMEPSEDPVNLDLAVRQHENYVGLLRDEVGLKVISLPGDDALPDCVFVEDIAVAIGNKAVITTPGHPSRRGETAEMKKALAKLGMQLILMKEEDPSATLDGGDVLFTGEEIFVGISRRTNDAGYNVLKRVFPEFPVTPVPVGENLHLKSCCSLAGVGKIVIGVGAGAKNITDALRKRATKEYTYIPVQGNGSGANCLYINSLSRGRIVIAPSLEKFPDSKQSYDSLSDVKVFRCDASEVGKVDGALTCCSVLLTVDS